MHRLSQLLALTGLVGVVIAAVTLAVGATIFGLLNVLG